MSLPTPKSSEHNQPTTSPRTPIQAAQQILLSAIAGFSISTLALLLYCWVWDVPLPLATIVFRSLVFAIYAGALSLWLGDRVWKLLGWFINGLPM
ncbi:MAG: hypothetical protein F6J87_01610 [Spirulina sp. SIO3F2]|nr:hypothetical protein [Spirulina sp. SIO3F2]